MTLLFQAPQANNAESAVSAGIRALTGQPYQQNNDLPPAEIILATMTALNALQSHLRDKQKIMNILHIITANLQREMDDELLCEIFLRCIPTNRNPRTHVSEAPLLLTRVCRKWTGIAVSMKRLWAKIHIACIDYVLPTQYDRDDSFNGTQEVITLADWPATIAGIEQWFARSGNHPLSVSISSTSSMVKDDNGWGCPALGYTPTEYFNFSARLGPVLAERAYRLESLEYVGPRDLLAIILKSVAELDPENNNLQGTAFSLLHTARIICPRFATWGSRNGLPPLLRGILLAPALRDLSIQSNQALDARWAGLTRLSIHTTIHRDIALYILKQCDALEVCSFDMIPAMLPTMPDGSLDAYVRAAQGGIIMLPHLKTLLIKGERDDDGNICGHIHTPALKHFLYHPSHHPETMVYPEADSDHGFTSWSPPPQPARLIEIDVLRPSSSPLCAFLSQCTSLETLTLNPHGIVAHEVLAILQSTPQITNLVLDQRRPSEFPGDYPPLQSPFKFNLRPLLEQQLVSIATGLSTRIPELLVPNLKSFSALSFSLDDISFSELLVQFINDRIFSLRDTCSGPGYAPVPGSQDSDEPSVNQTTATLERVTLTLNDAPHDIPALILEHAESVGRTVGDNLIIDISYPWAEKNSWEVEHAPSVTSEGLHIMTGVTWPYPILSM